MSKVTIRVEDGASHSIVVTRTASTTGAEYESRTVKAGDEAEIDFGDEQNITVTRGAATTEDEAPAEESTAKKK